MSKDFEQAYKELAQNEIPDLWDRIEAGLKEKSAPEQKKAELNDVKVEKTTKKKNAFIPVHYMGMAAAVIGAVVGIPALLAISQVSEKSSSAGGTGRVMESAYDTAAAGTASEEICEAAQEEAEAADMADGANENGAREEADGQVKQEMKQEVLKAEEALEDTDAEKDGGTDGMETKGAGSSEAVKTEMAETENGFMDGEAFNLTVEVIKEREVYDENEKAPSGMLFSAIIQEDASGSFDAGEQIEIYVSADSSLSLAAGSWFQVDIVYESAEEYPFRLQLCKKVAER